ncbi:glycosyltransferase family 32 protein [Coniochaeta sp. 2T2.1]|nr:glycosyltransferase family 32 protein [Coniochaeta sp. 2T2.1]
MSENISLLADGAPNDEEQVTPTPRRPRRRLPRNKVLAYLLLIDLIIVALLVYITEPLITLLRRNEELFTPNLVLSHDAPAYTEQRKIPKILHQTTANATIPDKWVDSQRSCKKAYSDFEYKLWTDATARQLIATDYPWFLDSWDNYAFPIQRADSIRYFVLYHYGGIYLDMDTLCNQTLPLDQLETGTHSSIYKSTLPTGITNDFMVTTARHPVYASTISKLPFYYRVTRFWARIQPYVNIMLSSGPLFLTLVVKDYLLDQPSLPSPSIQVINATELAPYFTDLESSTWHRADAHALMWLGTRPWTWFTMAAVGLVIGLCVVNYLMLLGCTALRRRMPSVAYAVKLAKLS